MAQLVPLSNAANQSLIVSLNIDGVVKQFFWTLTYNNLAGYWVLSISDSNKNLLLDSIPLITGEAPSANILGQFAYLGIGSAYIIKANSNQRLDYPDSVSLGNDFVLIWGDTPTK